MHGSEWRRTTQGCLILIFDFHKSLASLPLRTYKSPQQMLPLLLWHLKQVKTRDEILGEMNTLFWMQHIWLHGFNLYDWQ